VDDKNKELIGLLLLATIPSIILVLIYYKEVVTFVMYYCIAPLFLLWVIAIGLPRLKQQLKEAGMLVEKK